MEVVIEKCARDKEIRALGTVLYELPMINSYVLRIDDAQNLGRFKKLKKVTYSQTTALAAQVQGLLPE